MESGAEGAAGHASSANSQSMRLTALAHGGGCGCKLSPGVLRELLAGQPLARAFPNLLVGTETSDDAAVYRLESGECVIATTDFFMPIVDDPYDFGRIAATNALSDIYAMGGRPIMALAILGMPLGKLPTEAVARILSGGRDMCAAAGIAVAGGHSIDAPEPIYGLAVVGTCREEQLRTNAAARSGDVLILTKPLGVGIYSAAIKQGLADAQSYDEMLFGVTQLNRIGAELGLNPDVHAMTDVTGFGLLGHALEMARGSGLGATIEVDALPFLSHAEKWAKDGVVTGASHRNWESYGNDVTMADALPEWRRHMLTDPQTSGGLLVAVTKDSAPRVLAQIKAAGFAQAAVIGTVDEGRCGVTVA